MRGVTLHNWIIVIWLNHCDRHATRVTTWKQLYSATRRTRELHKWKEKCSLLLTDDWSCKYLLPICDNFTADSKDAVLENFLRVWDCCLFSLCCWALYRPLTLYFILVDAIRLRKISHVMTCSTRSDMVKSVIQAPWTHPYLTLQNLVI